VFSAINSENLDVQFRNNSN